MPDVLSRPNLLVFVDETGENIYNQFNIIVKSAGPGASLQKNLGLILYNSTHQSASYGLFNEKLSMSALADHSTNEVEQIVEYVLEMLGEENKSHTTELNKTDSPTAEKLPRIYLIGDINSLSIGKALKAARAGLLKKNADPRKVEIYYVLSGSLDSPGEDNKGPSQQAPTVRDWEEHEIPNFCYLYPAPEHLYEKDIYYEIARVLFILVATHIVLHLEFEQLMSIERKTGSPPFGILRTNFISISTEDLSDYHLYQSDDDLSDKWIAVPVNSTLNEDHQNQTVVKEKYDVINKIKGLMDVDDPDKKFLDLFSLKNMTKLYRDRNKQQASDNWVIFLSSEGEKRYKKWGEDTKKEFETAKNSIANQFDKDDTSLIGDSVKVLVEELNEYHKKESEENDLAKKVEEKKIEEKKETVSKILERSPSGLSLGVLVFLALTILIFLVITSFSPFAKTFQTILFFGGTIVVAALPAISFFWWYRWKLVTAQDALLDEYSDYYRKHRLRFIDEQKFQVIESLLKILQDKLKRMPEHWDEIAEVTMWVEKSLYQQGKDSQPAITKPPTAFIRKAIQKDFDWETIYEKDISGSEQLLVAPINVGNKTNILGAALFLSNSPTGINIDALFPLKKAPGSAL